MGYPAVVPLSSPGVSMTDWGGSFLLPKDLGIGRLYGAIRDAVVVSDRHPQTERPLEPGGQLHTSEAEQQEWRWHTHKTSPRTVAWDWMVLLPALAAVSYTAQ